MKTIQIMKHSKLWFIVSGAVILLGLIMMIMNGLNLGIDFTGGTMLQVELGQTVSVDEVKEVIGAFDLNADIVHSGVEKTEVIIKTKASLNNDERTEVFEALQAKYNLDDKALRGAEQFGPSMGKEIRDRAIMAILIASAAMLIYITIRFETVFGIAAIISLLHDVFFLLAIYAIFNITINSSFIAAVLTIVGYSINDTIVVFDRVRENVKREKNKTHAEIIDLSITQTITRTLNTSVTTLLVVGALFVLGVPSIRQFAFPLLVGISIGTYSSIFIASPVWAIVRKRIGTKASYASK